MKKASSDSGTLSTLYKRTSSGASQEWTIGVGENKDGTAWYEVTHGQVGGKMQTARVAVLVGKNIGKRNETTPLQQACSEASAKHSKQKDRGYVETLDTEVMAAAVELRPMLAQEYKKHKHKIDWSEGVLVQPKLDGLRCLAHKGQGGIRLVSRGNKPIGTVPHVNRALDLIMKDGEVFDGELYIHGDVTFQQLVSLVKRAQPGSEKVEYHVYDQINDEIFEFRSHNLIERLCEEHSQVVLPVATLSASSSDEVDARYAEFVAMGYEGAMVRVGECPYREGARSQHLLKYKNFLDDEFEIVGVGDGKGKFEGLALFTLRTNDGAEFEATPRGTESQRRAYFARGSELIGRFATVRFFEWTSSQSPVPRFPVLVAIRDYE